MEKLTSAEFEKNRREKLLDYKIYVENFDQASATIKEVRLQLRRPSIELEKVPLSAFLQATAGLASEATDHLANGYSGGNAISDLRSLYPTVVECWEIYARYSEAYDRSEQGRGNAVAHIPLLGDEYTDANRLVCFAILLGWGNLIERLTPVLDYNNPCRDGLLERLISRYAVNRGQAPDECARHLPYYKTLKIFNANPEQRQQLMEKYLNEWYYASRREPYYDSHQKGTSFHGYWAWEAAAITFLLDIDDSSYRDATFYPADLVEFARVQRNRSLSNVRANDAKGELRARSGDACPRRGLWESLTDPVVRRIFEQGNVMSNLHASYGLTVWIFRGEA